MLKLAHDLEFTDLHRRAGLERVDAAFLAHVAAVDAPLHAALLGARAHPEALAPKAESELLIALAPHLEDFTGITCAAAKASRSPTTAPTSPARSTRRTTASGATSRARIPARAGLPEKAPTPGFKKSPFGVSLAGCPLEEKISEFQKLKSAGFPVAALAMITVDNPMAAGTGTASATTA
jgi:hypothetical protein